jgi:hypothetical protein
VRIPGWCSSAAKRRQRDRRRPGHLEKGGGDDGRPAVAESERKIEGRPEGTELFEIVTISSRGFATLLLHSRASPFWYSGAHSRARLGQLFPRALLTSVFQFFGLIYPQGVLALGCSSCHQKTELAPPCATRGLATRWSRSRLPPYACDAACFQLRALPSPSSRPRHPLPAAPARWPRHPLPAARWPRRHPLLSLVSCFLCPNEADFLFSEILLSLVEWTEILIYRMD